MGEPVYQRMSAHEKIMQLRAAMDIPEEETDPEEDRRWEETRKLRLARMNSVTTNEEYVAKFNRDPYNDQWLGEGPDPDIEIVNKILYGDKNGKSKKDSSNPKMWNLNSYLDWKKKYYPEVPTIHLPAEAPESKKVKKLRKKRKKMESKAARQEQYDLAYWFLESWCTESFRDELYMKYAGKLEELVDFCCEYATAWAEDLTHDERPEMTAEDVMDRVRYRQKEESEVVSDVGGIKFKRLGVAERKKREYVADPYEDPFPDIPDEYWDEFSDWADKHPLKEFKKLARSYGPHIVDAIGMRRIVFLKKINKRNKSFRKNLLKHDPLSGAQFVSKKKYEAHMKRQLEKFDKQRLAFVKMLDEMVAKGQISPEMSERMMGDTKLVRRRVLKRHQEEYERIKFNQKQIKKENEKRKKEYEARKKWFKDHGSDINAPAFTVEIDGEPYTYEAKKTSYGKTLYKMTSPSRLECSEDVDGFLQKPCLISETPPVPPDPDLGDDYNELPDY